MREKAQGRRQFLKESAALAGLTVGAMRAAGAQTFDYAGPSADAKGFRPYGERSPFEKSVRSMPPDTPGFTPLGDSVGIITPSALHFVNNHYNLPKIDPTQHRLLIHGLVDRPLILTLEELKSLPSVSRIHFLECTDNSSRAVKDWDTVQAHGRTGCSEWTGVLLSLLLKEAGVQKGASWVVAEGADAGKHSKSLPLEKAMDDIIVAYGQNGEALRPENGYPLRLVNPGFEGVSNIKWLRRIKVVDQPYMSRAESTSYSRIGPGGKARWFQFRMGPKSVITRPSGGQRLPGPGFCEITGLAWSGWGAVRKVEVSTNGGRTWQDAQLQEPVLRMAHTRFRFDWTWDGEEAVLQSRCTDESDTIQPTVAELSKIWGLSYDYLKTTTKTLVHTNFIQPWKVRRDGSIQNGIWDI